MSENALRLAVHAGALWSWCMPGRGEGSSHTMLATARPSCSAVLYQTFTNELLSALESLDWISRNFHTIYRHHLRCERAHWDSNVSFHFSMLEWQNWGVCQFFTQLVAMATSTLRYRKTRSRSIICTQNAFIRWKDCKNQSSGSWDNLSPRNH